MDLKELLGEELYNQVIEKAGDNKLAIVSDGNWIPKEKFDDKIQEAKDLQEELNNRDEQLEELKKVDPAELQKTIDDLQEANENQKNEYEEKLQQQAFNHKLENTLANANVRNTTAVKALLDLDIVKLEDDELKGLNEQIESLKESDSYLFESEDDSDPKPNFTTGQHQISGDDDNDPFAAKLAQYK